MDGFKLVEQADKPPGKCIASRDIEGPFIDTGNNITERGRVYLSCRWVKEVAAEFCDMIPREEIEAELEELRQRLAENAERTAELQEFYDSQKRLRKAAERLAA